MQATEEYQYDRCNRMKYHPDFHFKHKVPFTPEELEYICKYYEHDHIRNLAFAIGKTEATIREKIKQLRRDGLYEYYKTRNKYW